MLKISKWLYVLRINRVHTTATFQNKAYIGFTILSHYLVEKASWNHVSSYYSIENRIRSSGPCISRCLQMSKPRPVESLGTFKDNIQKPYWWYSTVSHYSHIFYLSWTSAALLVAELRKLPSLPQDLSAEPGSIKLSKTVCFVVMRNHNSHLQVAIQNLQKISLSQCLAVPLVTKTSRRHMPTTIHQSQSTC